MAMKRITSLITALALALLASDASAGATRVKSTGKISWTGVSSMGSFATLPSVGNMIICVMSGANVSIDFSAVADNQTGNTYHQAVQSAVADAANRTRAAVWYSDAIVGSAGTFTITVTHTAGQGQWACTEYSGMATASALDVSTSNRGVTTVNPNSGTTATTTQADEVVAGAMAIRATQSSITNAGWTEEYETLDFAADEPGEGDTKIIAAAGTQISTWTVSATTANGWCGVIATFKVAAAGGGTRQSLPLLNVGFAAIVPLR